MHDIGCLGLVHWDDPEGWIDVNPSTPEEALAIQKIRSDNYFELINVYYTE